MMQEKVYKINICPSPANICSLYFMNSHNVFSFDTAVAVLRDKMVVCVDVVYESRPVLSL